MEIDYSLENHDALYPVRRGIVKDWVQMERLWRTTLDEIGLAFPESASVMLTEGPHSTLEDRKRWAELLIDTFRHPSICIANSAPLSLFASGRTTGLVVECGAGVTSTVPVFEGLALTHAAITSAYGGEDITRNLQSILLENKITMDYIDICFLKERLAFAHLSKPDAYYDNKETTSFGLPDGTEVTVNTSIFGDCIEPLFSRTSSSSAEKPDMSLMDQIPESLRLCDDSVRDDLVNNVIISGGTSMTPGLGDRLAKDLRAVLADADGKGQSQGPYDVRVIPDSTYREPGYTTQRKTAPWIGGSIIASLSTYKQLKVTRQEWEESKDACIQTKCI